MKDDHVYTKKEISKLIDGTPKIRYVGFVNKEEEFKQIRIGKIYIPYLISSFGRIFSINYNKRYHSLKQLKTNFNSDYERISITYGDSIRTLSIHRLVAKAFIPNDDPKRKTEVNHIDGNKSNNMVDNLEWITPSNNVLHAFRTGLKAPRRKFTEESIHRVCQLLMSGYPIKDIVSITGVPKDTINDVLHNKCWKTISKDYDLSRYHHGMLDDDYKKKLDNVHYACKLFIENNSIKDIKAKTGMSDNQVRKILSKRIYHDITSKYDFSNYNYGK